MAQLSNLHELALLTNIETRFERQEIYTEAGSCLVVLNPYTAVPELISSEMVQSYHSRHRDQLEPHIFKLCQTALESAFSENISQVIIPSGESGAGKTETARHAIMYLTSVCSGTSQLEDRILACTPILEAFGNAKTLRNDNSTRFGKFLKLHLNSQSRQITGASISAFLLEKSRVVSHGPDERNFHIFYIFLKGCSQELLERLKLRSYVDEYRYLRGVHEIESLDEVEWFSSMMDAMNMNEFSMVEQMTLWKMLSAILNLGNIEFDISGNSACMIRNRYYLDIVSEMLQLDAKELERSLTYASKHVDGISGQVPISKEECELHRDTMAQTLYERMFGWIVKKLNQSLGGGDGKLYVGLVDMFGFEAFLENKFEQFCINYCNEKLHQVYLSSVFKAEQEEFSAENLEEYYNHINYTDNQPILDLYERSPLGIFQLIDQFTQSDYDDSGLIQTIEEQHSSDPNIEFSQRNPSKFTLLHTTNFVEYNIQGFLHKNLDMLPTEIENCIMKSRHILIKSMLDSSDAIINKQYRLLGARFRRQMTLLLDEFKKAECHFVKCIKPNDNKFPYTFTQRIVFEQIHYFGILDSIEIRRKGYPIRISHSKFFHKLKELHPDFSKLVEDSKDRNWKKLNEDILEAVVPGLSEKFVLIGRNKIFLKYEVFSYLEKLKEDALYTKHQAARVIQRNATGWVHARRYKKFLHAIISIQRLWRCRPYIQEFHRKRGSSFYLKAWAQGKVELYLVRAREIAKDVLKRGMIYILHRQFTRNKFIHFMSDAYTLKGCMARDQLVLFKQLVVKMRNEAAAKIQSNFRGYIFRKKNYHLLLNIKDSNKYKAEQLAAIKIQSWARGELVRSKFRRMHQAARYIQGFFRAKWTYSLFRKVTTEVRRIQRCVRSFLTRKRIIHQRTEAYVAQESALLSNLKLLEHSELFSTVSSEPSSHLQEALRTLTALAETNASISKSVLAQTGSLAQQSKAPTPFHIERLYFFSRALDLDILTDLSLLYDPLWSKQFEILARESIQREEQVMDIEVGSCHTAGLTTRGKVFMWGWNDKGQCVGNQKGKPKIVEQLKEKKILMVRCGDDHSLALDTAGVLYAFGDNSKGQLGQGNYTEIKDPVIINLPQVKQVCAMGAQNLAVTEEGELHIWPYQTIHGEKRSYPNRILPDQTVTEVSMGYDFAVIVVSSGLVFSFGTSNQEGQLGLGDFEPRTSPCLVEELKREKVTGVSCGFRHVIAKGSLGKVYSWGWNGKGQLGLGDFQSRNLPQMITWPGQKSKVLQVAAGWRHSVLMLDSRKLMWFGSNGDIKMQPVPRSVNLASRLPEFFSQANQFSIIKVTCSWSRSISATMITIADLRYLNIPHQKLQNALSLLSSKWTSKSIEPPYVDSLVSFYPTIVMKKGSPSKSLLKSRGIKKEESNLGDIKSRLRLILAKPEDRWTQEDRKIMETVLRIKK
jgi:alpha-tubulin suppressor-like RCC1 family protein